jgi:hypothetical protein
MTKSFDLLNDMTPTKKNSNNFDITDLIFAKELRITKRDKTILQDIIKDIDHEVANMKGYFNHQSQIDLLTNIERRLKLICLILSK